MLWPNLPNVCLITKFYATFIFAGTSIQGLLYIILTNYSLNQQIASMHKIFILLFSIFAFVSCSTQQSEEAQKAQALQDILTQPCEKINQADGQQLSSDELVEIYKEMMRATSKIISSKEFIDLHKEMMKTSKELITSEEFMDMQKEMMRTSREMMNSEEFKDMIRSMQEMSKEMQEDMMKEGF